MHTFYNSFLNISHILFVIVFTSSGILGDYTLHIEAFLVGFDDLLVENRAQWFPVRERLFQCYSDVISIFHTREVGGKKGGGTLSIMWKNVLNLRKSVLY